jgi:uncharacterized protein
MRERIGLEGVKPVLEAAKTIAVLGVSANADKPAHYVPQYMFLHGYTVLPVNGSMVGQVMFDQPVTATLAELKQPIDIVNMFRRSEFLESHLEDILAMRPQPKLVWLQLGIRNDEFITTLINAGIEVVQDRCLLADHKNLRL